MKKIILFIIFFTTTSSFIEAKDYDASFFGIESNGIKLNTRAIQKAIDYISENGGGKLIFSVGRYLSGTIYLKSNVILHLKEGAVIMGSTDPLNYDYNENWTALIFAINQQNIGITGKGTIDGRGYSVAQNLIDLIHKGVIKDEFYNNDRPYARIRPQNIYFKGCRDITISGVSIKNAACWTQQYDQCTNLSITNTFVDSKNYWNNDGMDIVDCDSVLIANNYVDASDDAICLKSHDFKIGCKNITIRNNIIRSSASGIKFGTYSFGGYKKINIINNKVYNTYRSAITFSAMDGNIVEGIVVDSLFSINTGNVLFLRIGERFKDKIGKINNITIKNVFADVPAEKPDKGYPYEGPIEDNPRNISPIVITGLPSSKISNLNLQNINVVYPGGADINYANVPLNELDSIPELNKKYPEFSMFKELPAWAFYIRHAEKITLDTINLSCKQYDFRKAFVFDDVQDVQLVNIKINNGSNGLQRLNKKHLHLHNCSKINLE